MQTNVKRPTEARIYEFDFGAQPEFDDLSAVITAGGTVTATPAGLTIGAPTVSGTKIRVLISGGASGTPYLLEATVPVTGGLMLVERGMLRVVTEAAPAT